MYDKIQYVPLGTTHETKETIVQRQWKGYSIAAKFCVFTLVVLASLHFFDIFNLNSLPQTALNVLNELQQMPQISVRFKGYLIDTPGCRIPDMDPFDSAVKEFIFAPPEQKCLKVPPPIFESTATHIYMNLSALSFYNNTVSLLDCCYQEFDRQDPSGFSKDNKASYNEQCIKVEETVTSIKSEFIKVTCTNQSKNTVYEDYFAFVPKVLNKSSTAQRLRPNVLIIGLDGVSRINLHRQLPKTYEFLMKNLSAVELLGYNKVGDNTFPNLIPVLTGLFEEELKEVCWQNHSTHFDQCPFVWKNYSMKGYTTASGEDCAWIGLFNYQKVGFKKKPTDYYYTTFSKQLESNIGNNNDMNCAQCVGSRMAYKVTLDYIKKFTSRMLQDDSPYFAFFWSNSLSHDYLNKPASGDAQIEEFFRQLNDNGSLNDTVLIFMSDHGIRWGSIRQTYQGQMEERLPFVIMAFPTWFKESYPDAVRNVESNVRRLTTPFDLHETLKHLLHVSSLESQTHTVNEQKPRGYSLFDKIPKTRTCQEADIESHWCTCQESTSVSTNDTQVVKAAHFAVLSMNQFLKGYAQCANLELEKIINARVLSHDSTNITRKHSIKDYRMTLQTIPGGAVFEVTMRLNDSSRIPTENSSDFTITGTVSRINPYGKQSSCITDFHLKLYCFCKSLIKA